MMKNRIVYVLDTETTGLDGYPNDFVVELAINRVNLSKNEYDNVFNEIIGHDIKEWSYYQRDGWIFNNTDISLEMVKNAPKYKFFEGKIYNMLQKRSVTSFNRRFDFNKFLNWPPYNFKTFTKKFPCIMLEAMNICKIPGYNGYKWPTLDEAYRILVDKPLNQLHRALDDTNHACEILLKINEKNSS